MENTPENPNYHVNSGKQKVSKTNRDKRTKLVREAEAKGMRLERHGRRKHSATFRINVPEWSKLHGRIFASRKGAARAYLIEYPKLHAMRVFTREGNTEWLTTTNVDYFGSYLGR